MVASLTLYKKVACFRLETRSVLSGRQHPSLYLTLWQNQKKIFGLLKQDMIWRHQYSFTQRWIDVLMKNVSFLMAEQIFLPILSVCAFFLDSSLVGMASSTPPTTSYLVTRNKNVACYSLRPMLRFHKWKKPPESLSDKKGERALVSIPPTLPQNTTNFVDPLYRGRTNHLCCTSTNKFFFVPNLYHFYMPNI